MITEKPVKGKKLQWPRWGIRGKILLPYLALSIVALGVLSAFALRNMSSVGRIAINNTISLGESAVNESVRALEDSGRRLIRMSAQLTAKDIEIFLFNNPGSGIPQFQENSEFQKYAIQSVGQTGTTMIYGKDGLIYFNADKSFIGTSLWGFTSSSDLLAILTSGINGEAAGYYDARDADGNIRSRYMCCVPIKDTDFSVAASTFIDEFSRPADETESKITASVSSVTNYIDRQMQLSQWTFIIIILGMVIIVVTMVSFFAGTITRSIRALAMGSWIIAQGQLDYRIKLETGDEIQQLAEQFNMMAATLKESYSNLEQKVEERTKQERQRAEQLRTINEISRKISSIIDLDELLPYVVNILRETFGYYNVNIFLLQPDSADVILKALCISGYQAVIPSAVPLEIGPDSLVGWVAKTGEPMMVNDVSREPMYRVVEELRDTRSELAAAVKMGDKVLGVLDIESDQVDAFNEFDLFTAQTLADQLAVAIDNARLYEETGKMAVVEERNRMAREIHDTLAQGFAGIILQLEAAEQASGEHAIDDPVYRHINRAKSLARENLNEARRSVWNLRTQSVEEVNLPEALNQEIMKFNKSSDIRAHYTVEGEKRELPGEISTGMLRICQESLANIRKHSQATEVNITLSFERGLVKVTVQDNGKGFNPVVLGRKREGKSSGFGLISMQERTRNLGGTFEIQSEEGQGTLITVSIPFH